MNRSIAIIILVLLLAWLLAQTSPVVAQTPFVTPTPLPAIQATAQAAQHRADEARDNLQQAAQLEAQAAEIRRNADTQADQAAQAWSDARSAAASQNGAAFGEAIGRGEAALTQLQTSVTGQAAIVATLNVRSDVQAQTILSMTNELQQARAERATVVNAYAAMVSEAEKKQADQADDDVLSYIVKGFLFVVVTVLFVAFAWLVISQRRERVTIIDAPQVEHDEVIDTE